MKTCLEIETWKEASVTVKKTPKRPNSVNMSNETNIYQKGPSWVEGDLQTRLTCYLSREKRPTYMKNRLTKWKETYQKWKGTFKRNLLAISNNVKRDLHTWKETYKIEKRPSKQALVSEREPTKRSIQLKTDIQIRFIYRAFLQKRPVFLRSLLVEATA